MHYTKQMGIQKQLIPWDQIIVRCYKRNASTPERLSLYRRSLWGRMILLNIEIKKIFVIIPDINSFN